MQAWHVLLGIVVVIAIIVVWYFRCKRCANAVSNNDDRRRQQQQQRQRQPPVAQGVVVVNCEDTQYRRHQGANRAARDTNTAPRAGSKPAQPRSYAPANDVYGYQGAENADRPEEPLLTSDSTQPATTV